MTTITFLRHRSPHRTDYIGSLSHPRAMRDRGVFDHEQTLVEKMTVRHLVKLQNEAGPKIFLNSEVRRQF